MTADKINNWGKKSDQKEEKGMKKDSTVRMPQKGFYSRLKRRPKKKKERD